MASYSSYALNINSRALDIDEESYDKIIDKLSGKVRVSGSDSSLYENELLTLKEQYEDWKKDGKVDKSARRKRSIRCGDLLQDRYGMLVKYGACRHPFEYIYELDLTQHLDLILAVALQRDYDEEKRALEKLSKRLGLSKEYISYVVLNTNKEKPMERKGVVFGDILDLPGVEDYIKELILSSQKYNKNPIEMVGGTNCYADLITGDTFGLDLVQAFILKLLLTVNDILETTVVDFYAEKKSRNLQGFVLSQYITGLIINIDEPVDLDIIYYYGTFEQKLPIRRALKL